MPTRYTAPCLNVLRTYPPAGCPSDAGTAAAPAGAAASVNACRFTTASPPAVSRAQAGGVQGVGALVQSRGPMGDRDARDYLSALENPIVLALMVNVAIELVTLL